MFPFHKKLKPSDSHPSPGFGISSRRAEGWLALALFVLVFVVFHRVLKAGFLFWDDNVLLTENPHFGGLNFQRLKWMFTDFDFVWRYMPLTWLGWCLTYDLFGLNPFGYHLGNLVLHGFNSGLVFLLISQLVKRGLPQEASSSSETYRCWCACLAAAVWAVHPLRVEPVAWITDRVYDQTVFFFLIALLSYLRALEKSPANPARQGVYWVSVSSLAASFLSFPTGLGFIVVLVVLDFYPQRRFNSGPGWWRDRTARRICWEKVPFLVVTVLALLTTTMARFNTEGLSITSPLGAFTPGARIMQAGYIWAYFLWKPWLPLHLAPVYTTLMNFKPTDAPFVASMAVVLLISLVLVWRRHQWPMAMALWICYLAILVPVLGLTEHPHYPSDRYSMLASLCWSVLLAAWLWTLRHRHLARSWASGLVLTVIAVLSILSIRQVEVWQNNTVFFQYVIDRLDSNQLRATMYGRKGYGHWEIGQQAQALDCFGDALRIFPANPALRRSRGRLYMEMGRWSEAIEDFRVPMRNQPESDDHKLLGSALAQIGNWSAAASQFEEVLRREPKNAQAHFNLAMAQEQQQQFAGAMAHYRSALEYRPDWPEAMANLARVLIASPTPDPAQVSEAVPLAEKACRLTQFQQPQFLPILADAYAVAGRWDQAMATIEQAAHKAEALGLTNVVKDCLMRLESFRKRQTHQMPER
jgi:tetratricopeptide (TPR) repeat protein